MLFKALAALTVAASALAQASQNLTITAPSPTWWWIEESENKLAWAAGNPSDSTTVYINHKDNNVIAGGTLAIKAITNVYDYSTLLTLPPGVKPAKGYFITIVDSIYQGQRVYGQSQEFEVKPKGSAYPDQNQDLSGRPQTSASESATGSAGASASKSGASSAPSASASSGAQQNMAATALAAGAAALAYVAVA
ncbi:hypothetical protein A1Q2_05473 [Trichosporon asahii var. asahii CBS 8904]|uniref:Uncharacterized protein n=1 Tax=Trichosporon asahii var. asahii (strain CBS 8904) TaxID=1220162 RepID=K1VHH7_TRIAC|nr:hypothetical protein A1Q2_05473 [Trichosporon asahii var. asahii CBS 8904]